MITHCKLSIIIQKMLPNCLKGKYGYLMFTAIREVLHLWLKGLTLYSVLFASHTQDFKSYISNYFCAYIAPTFSVQYTCIEHLANDLSKFIWNIRPCPISTFYPPTPLSGKLSLRNLSFKSIKHMQGQVISSQVREQQHGVTHTVG